MTPVLRPVPSWVADAACGGTGDVMWPDALSNAEHRRQVAAAISTYCRVCPVKAECALAGKDEPYGIWGGVYRHKGRVAS